MKKTLIPISFLAVLVFGLGSINSKLSSNSGGAVSSRTGAPDGSGGQEATCTSCHGNVANSGPNSASISIAGNPTGFMADSVYTVTVSVNNPVGSAAGFQVVALGGPNFSTFGTLAKIGNTSKIVLGNGRTYLTHTSSSLFSWSFNWTAPSSGLTDSMTFYAAVNETVGGARRTYTTTKTFRRKILTSSPEFQQTASLKVFPFQVEKEIFVGGIPFDLSNGRVQIVSQDGRQVLNQALGNAGLQGIQLPSNMSPGQYFIRISGLGYQAASRFQKI
jgi:hypothetical protein